MSGLTPVLSLLLLVSALFVLTACEQQHESPPAAPPQVVVVTLAPEDITPRTEIVGRTRASEDVRIKAQVSGPLLKRHFREGDDVEAGALLYEIDPNPFITSRRQRQAAVDQAQASYDTATVRYQRGTIMHKKGLISDMNMDELSNLRLEAQARLSQTEAELQTAELELSYTQIRAPISGRISSTQVSLGELITPQKEMANLVQLQPMWVDFQASERSMVKIMREIRKDPAAAKQLGQAIVRLRLPDGQLYDQIGTIDFVDNRIDPTTGTLAMRASMPNSDQSLLPGLYVTVLLEAPQPEQALLIPQIAVQEDQLGRFVMLVNAESKVEKRQVELGRRYGIKWQVLEGLQSGEKVITEGLQVIRNGSSVVAVEQEAAPFEETPE